MTEILQKNLLSKCKITQGSWDDDEPNDLLTFHRRSEDNVACEAYSNCVNTMIYHHDNALNSTTTVVILLPVKLLNDKKPALGSAKKMIKDVIKLNPCMRLNINNIKDRMAQEFFTFSQKATAEQFNTMIVENMIE